LPTILNICGFEPRSAFPFDRKGGPAQEGPGHLTREGRPMKKLLIPLGILVALLLLARKLAGISPCELFYTGTVPHPK